MKTFSNLTKEDAIKILQAAYPFLEDDFKIKTKDDSTLLISTEVADFTFEEQEITIIQTIEGVTIHNDVLLACYIEAYKLGYKIDLLEEFIESLKENKKENYYFVSYFFSTKTSNGYGNYNFKNSFFDLHNFTSIIKAHDNNIENVVILNFKEITKEEYLKNINR